MQVRRRKRDAAWTAYLCCTRCQCDIAVSEGSAYIMYLSRSMNQTFHTRQGREER